MGLEKSAAVSGMADNGQHTAGVQSAVVGKHAAHLFIFKLPKPDKLIKIVTSGAWQKEKHGGDSQQDRYNPPRAVPCGNRLTLQRIGVE